MPKLRGVAVLGSTGSIGVSTLDVLSRHTEEYRVVALTAYQNGERLLQQCRQFKPEYAVLVDESAARHLAEQLKAENIQTEVLTGAAALADVVQADQVEVVMAAIVGAAGLRPTLAAVKAGKRLLLANKESLVMTGDLLLDEAKRSGAEILPIDSEHNAIFQCLPAGQSLAGVEGILLTASGGPFRQTPLTALASVTPEQACAHPNWEMGRKISVDSATMMNKGLEMIEACFLFGLQPQQIQIVIHPQSVVHSMVSYCDGSVLAQMGSPDMRTPIAYGLSWPKRIDSGVEPLNVFTMADLQFERPDDERFPCIKLAYQAMAAGGTAPAILNAANEVAVKSFLEGQLAFTQIAELVDATLQAQAAHDSPDLSQIEADDQAARRYALSKIG